MTFLFVTRESVLTDGSAGSFNAIALVTVQFTVVGETVIGALVAVAGQAVLVFYLLLEKHLHRPVCWAEKRARKRLISWWMKINE